MRFFDSIDAATLDRRDWQLWVLALAVILILASGMALLMYPAVFNEPFARGAPILPKVFFAFCLLSALLVGYLMDRHLVIRRLRSQLMEEQRRSARMREQASAELLETLPGREHFQDRLVMEFRRAANTRQPLSLVIVGLRPSEALVATRGTAAAVGDAAKALIRRLRREDSIYLFPPAVFGIILPGVELPGAGRVVERLQEGLADASGGDHFSFEVRMVNYPEHVKTAREMEQIALESSKETKIHSTPSGMPPAPVGT